MIPLLATAAILSCNEAQQLIDRLPREPYTRAQYRDIVRTIKRSAPSRCYLNAPYWYYRSPHRRVRGHRFYYPGVRPVWRNPDIQIYIGTPGPTWTF